MSKRLKILLYIITIWLAVMGILFLFFPSIAEIIMNARLTDKALNMLYGQVVLTFAYVAFLASRSRDGSSILSDVILVLTIGHVIIFGYQLVAGIQPFASVGIPLIINAIFSILLYIFRKDIKK